MPHSGSAFSDILEGLLRGAVPERMLVQHGPVEELLRFRVARCLEIDFAELFVVRLARRPVAANANAGRKRRSRLRLTSSSRVSLLAAMNRARPWIVRGNPGFALTLGAGGPEVISEKRDFYRRTVLVSAAEKSMLDRTLTFGRYRLEPRGGLMSGAREVRLTPKALALLSFIAERPGEVISKEELFGAVWPEVNVGDAALVTCIQELRRRSGTMPGGRVTSRRCTAAVTASSEKGAGAARRLPSAARLTRCRCPTVPRSRCCRSPT